MTDTMRAVPESVLEEALEQIVRSQELVLLERSRCSACDACESRHESVQDGAAMQDNHEPDCRYKRVTEALRRVLG
jgi:hypothetical protein